MIETTAKHAQRFILDKQGLLTDSPSKTILDAVKRIHNLQIDTISVDYVFIHNLQIDTISVVARSHDLTLYNRLVNYQEGQVWKLLEEKKLFEFWSHGICLIPYEEYPFYAWKMEYKKEFPHNWWKKWQPENQEVIKSVYNYVKKNGPTRSADFKREETRRSEGWWDWKKEKMALEFLFDQGKLLVAYRKNFQKFYDLTERVLPAGTNTEPLRKDELADYLINTVLSSLGIASFEELRLYLGRGVTRYLWNKNREGAMKYLQDCVNEDKLIEVQIESQEVKHFTLKEEENKLRKQNSQNDQNTPMKFLTPFDNAIRDRDLPLRLWNFDYKIECYTPEDQRIYGYFTLPILDGHSLIGRVDFKAHRKEKILEIKSIHFENWFKHTANSINRLASGLVNFADFHHCMQITFGDSVPSRIRKLLSTVLNSSYLS
jgi:uncharacterized protein YcaQ